MNSDYTLRFTVEANSLDPSKSDIFISYARVDRERVQPFADLLIEHGWTVWWDLRIRSGEQFHLIIEEALAKSACVIVVWTERSTQSRWVLAEADEGANRHILVPILLDQVAIPIAFRGIHTADFVNWSGDVEEEKVQTLIRDISAVAGQPESDEGTLVSDKDVVAVQLQLEPDKPDSVGTAPDNELTQLPVIRWLHYNATWLGTAGAIAAFVGLVTLFFSSPETSVGNTIRIEGNNGSSLIVGGDSGITNISDPMYKDQISSQQRTIELLLSQLSVSDQQTNDQIRDEITDAVTGLSAIDSTPSQIAQAEAALANGDTGLAQRLYKADAESKAASGTAGLQAVAQSYRRLGALVFLDDTAAALEAYQKAIEIWPDDISAWSRLGHLYQRTGQSELAIEAIDKVDSLVNELNANK